jgi:hypothetical protein
MTRILNGRFGTNSSISTCKNTSVVDYMIVSSNLFYSINSFEIFDFDPLLSDVHKTLGIEIDANAIKAVSPGYSNLNLVHEGENNEDYCYRWKVDNSNLFLECVDMDNVSKIVDDLDIMLQNTDVVENSQMNNVYSKVCDVFKTCADKSDVLKYTSILCHVFVQTNNGLTVNVNLREKNIISVKITIESPNMIHM